MEIQDLPIKWLNRLFKIDHISEFSPLYCVSFVFYPVIFHNRSIQCLFRKLPIQMNIFSPFSHQMRYSLIRNIVNCMHHFFEKIKFFPRIHSIRWKMPPSTTICIERICVFWMDSEISKGKRENRYVYFQSVDFFRIECLRLKGNPI